MSASPCAVWWCSKAAGVHATRVGGAIHVPHHLLWYALLALSGGIVLRSVPGVFALFGGTLIAGAAIAVGNVLMPQLIKHDFAGRAWLPELLAPDRRSRNGRRRTQRLSEAGQV
ncbi:hypothetical protein ACIQM0_21945 [Streptomyces sp. NPDC091387]|uniref:hypothetical protein n=1 Tax=Streptomyces sp. NPDC091387 TaxID=3365998 RepID=UPI0037F5C7F0